MIKVFYRGCHKSVNPAIISLIAVCLFILSCHNLQGHEKLEKKMPAILVNMLRSDDPVGYAERHGIGLKEGMVRVIITVDKNFLLEDISAKYGLMDFQKREDVVTTYISIDGLKEIYKEPGVTYIRLPVKFIHDGEP